MDEDEGLDQNLTSSLAGFVCVSEIAQSFKMDKPRVVYILVTFPIDNLNIVASYDISIIAHAQIQKILVVYQV